MMETFKEFTFEAAHKLEPYSGLHGHSFHVSVHVIAAAEPVFGWACNLYDLEEAIAAVQHKLDHRYLNDVKGLETPSLENLAQWIFAEIARKVPDIDRVLVRRGAPGHAEGCIYRRSGPGVEHALDITLRIPAVA